MRRRFVEALWRPLALLLAAMLGAAGCANFNLLSTDEEVKLGQQVAADVEKKSKLYPDPSVQRYVQSIGARLASASDRQDVNYTYKVIEDHRTVNAFAIPGGPIYIYTGLLRMAANEAELASVLAHETGHVAARHSAKHISQQIAVNVLVTLVLGENPGLAAQLGTELISGVGFSQMSQRDEYEADELGIAYMKRAGYDPRYSASFLKKLDTNFKSDPSPLAKLFATHPMTKDRIVRAEGLGATAGPGGRIGDDTYRVQMGRLMAEPLPPPPPPEQKSGSSSMAPTRYSPQPPALQPVQSHQPCSTADVVPTSSPAAPSGPPANRGQEPPMICRNLTKGNLVASPLALATTPEARRQGLLGRTALTPDEGMLLEGCRWVHTVGMKFAIDIVFLDKEMQVVRVLRSVPPGKAPGPCLAAQSTLELAAGAAALKRIEAGDRLLVARAPKPAPKGK